MLADRRVAQRHHKIRVLLTVHTEDVGNALALEASDKQVRSFHEPSPPPSVISGTMVRGGTEQSGGSTLGHIEPTSVCSMAAAWHYAIHFSSAMIAGMKDKAARTLRPARTGEDVVMRDLVRRAYAMYVPRMGKEPGPMLDDYAKRVADGNAFVAAVDGTIAGILVLLPYDDHLLMDNVAVDPAFQGGGIGRALIDFAEQEAARRGYREIRLYTHQTMTENVRMYGKLGYEETGRGTQAGYDRVFMRKTLA